MAIQPGGTTIVVSTASTIAGPGSASPVAGTLRQSEPWQAADRRQAQIDQLHGLGGVGMTIGLLMLLVEQGGELVEPRSGDRPVGERHGQLVRLAAVAHIGGAQQ